MAGQLVGPDGVAGQVHIAAVTVADDIDGSDIGTAVEVISDLLETVLAVLQHHHLDAGGQAGDELLIVTDGGIDEHHFVALGSQGSRRRSGCGLLRAFMARAVLGTGRIAGGSGVLAGGRGSGYLRGLGALVGDYGHRSIEHHAGFQGLNQARPAHGNAGVLVLLVSLPECHADLIQPLGWLIL
ncbi:hypothetical protein D3C78_574240 [compost metagenome]